MAFIVLFAVGRLPLCKQGCVDAPVKFRMRTVNVMGIDVYFGRLLCKKRDMV